MLLPNVCFILFIKIFLNTFIYFYIPTKWYLLATIYLFKTLSSCSICKMKNKIKNHELKKQKNSAYSF